MRKEKRKKSIFNKISNRLAYTLIAILIIVLVALVVYAAVDPTIFGHPLNEISAPAGCATNTLSVFAV